jgi:pyruvate kinase
MKKRTKIVATVGPSCESVEKMQELIRAGVNVFRLNFSHGTYDYHAQMLLNIREAMKKTDLIVGVLQYISGPKIRIGDIEQSFELRSGDILEFVKEDILWYMVK